MLARTLLLVSIAAVCAFAVAQATVLETDDVLDELRERFAEGYPTVAAVDELKAEALARFDAGDCENALPALESWAEQSNFLANLLRAGIRPFYRASSSDQRELSSALISQLVPIESAANARLSDRNLAWVMIAECHVQRGDNALALVFFNQALERLSVLGPERDAWERARTGMFRIIGY